MKNSYGMGKMAGKMSSSKMKSGTKMGGKMTTTKKQSTAKGRKMDKC